MITLLSRRCRDFLFGVVLAALPVTGVADERISLDGSWQFAFGNLRASDGFLKETSVKEWRRIAVPANWYNEGIDYSGVAWYRRDLPRKALRAFRKHDKENQAIAMLKFSGVDYAADVWLGETHAGFHEGYFSPFEFDVSETLASNSKSNLVVRVDSPEERAGPSWGLHKRLIKGVLSHHDTRPGGAWSHRGQEKNTGGIWQSVALEISTGVFLGPVTAAPNLVFADSGVLQEASIQIDTSVRRFRGMREATLVLRVFDPVTGEEVLEQSLGKVTARKPSIKKSVAIPDPKLWWPWGRGEQPIYRAEIVALDTEERVLHRRPFGFGLRSVKRNETSGEWLINSKRLFLKGTNYIATQWKSNFDREDYVRDLEMMRAANINAVRIHAQVEANRFYEAADELGMLVWQDFPLQWGYEDSAEFEASAERQLQEMIDSLEQHPSIIAWSIHNEPPWDADWMKWKYKDYNPVQNAELDEKLYQSALQRDATRYVHKVSRTKEHQWFGWYAGTIDTFAAPLTENLVSEFGAQALPKLESLKKIISPEHLWPDSPEGWDEWNYKNFQRKESFELAKIPMPSSTEEFISVSQGYQAQLISFAGAAYRSRQYQPLGAMFQFMFVEDWPSINWGVVDWYRSPKPGYEALRNVYASVVAVPVLQGQELAVGHQAVPIKLASDLWRSTPSVQIQVGLYDSLGEPVPGTQKQFSASAPADSVHEVAQWRLAAPKGSYEMRVTTQAADQQAVTQRILVDVVQGKTGE